MSGKFCLEGYRNKVELEIKLIREGQSLILAEMGHVWSFFCGLYCVLFFCLCSDKIMKGTHFCLAQSQSQSDRVQGWCVLKSCLIFSRGKTKAC